MGLCSSIGCCSERVVTEFFAEPFPIPESQSYRANFVHEEGVLESIGQVNLRVQEFDDMDRINKLLDTAEKRIYISQSLSSNVSECSSKALKSIKGKRIVSRKKR